MAKEVLRLYIIGQTPSARRAINNLEALFQETGIGDHYTYEVIDLLQNPTLAEEERIYATPLLIKKLPLPLRRVIGDLSERERVLVGLDIYDSNDT